LLRDRLEAVYGSDAEVRQSWQDAVWRVELRLPRREVGESR
jgi:hypothetical protein